MTAEVFVNGKEMAAMVSNIGGRWALIIKPKDGIRIIFNCRTLSDIDGLRNAINRAGMDAHIKLNAQLERQETLDAEAQP